MNIFSGCHTHAFAPRLFAPDVLRCISLSLKKIKKNLLSFFPLLFSISSGCPGEAPVTVKGQEWACSGVYRVANNTAKADKPPVDLPRALKHKPPLTICLKDVWKIPLDSLT